MRGPVAEDAPLGADEGAADEPDDAEATGHYVAPPSPPLPSAPPKAKGIVRRLVDGVRDYFGAAPLELAARLLHRDAEGLTVEIELDDELAWQLSAAVLVMPDGSERLVDIDMTTTTKAGRYGAGQVVRLTVRWQGSAPEPLPSVLRLDSDGRQLILSF